MDRRSIMLFCCSLLLGYLAGSGLINRETAEVIQSGVEKSFSAPPQTTEPASEKIPAITIERVIDGDTIKTRNGETIRYLGIDTPEITGKQPECFGKEAHEYNRSLVEGKVATVMSDKETQDRYKRELRFIFIEGENINIKLVRDGYAKRIYIAPNDLFQKELADAETIARKEKRGLWGVCRN